MGWNLFLSSHPDKSSLSLLASYAALRRYLSRSSISYRILKEILWSAKLKRLQIVVFSLLAAIFGLLAPLFQKIFVDRLMGIESFSLFQSWEIELCIGAAFLSVVLARVFETASVWIGLSEAFRLQSKFSLWVYEKMLRLRTDELGGRTVGEIVAIYASDVSGSVALLEQTLPNGASILFPLLLAPFAVYWISGIPMLWTSLAILIIIFVFGILSKRQARFFVLFKQLAAERVGLVSEWIQNIRLLRILGWTEAFENKIIDKRKIETRNRVSMVTNGQIMGAIGSTVSYWVNLVGVITLVWLRQGEITPGDLFALLWIFGVFLARPLRQFPWFLTFALDALTSLDRVERFLALPEEEEEAKASIHQTDYLFQFPTKSANDIVDTSIQGEIIVRQLNLEIAGRRLLKNISFRIAPGELVALVGEVGAGKSLLLSSLMGETGATFEQLQLSGQDALQMKRSLRRALFSYVPQESFVMSASLRENLALEYDTAQERDPNYHSALQRAEFEFTAEKVLEGLETEIGERGVNLSGGQRQRVSLARADIFSRPFLLIDDGLSAVDVETEQKLISGLLTGQWKNRTRLLVTHRLSALNHVDRIFFLQDGELLAQGRLDELWTQSPEFRQFAMTLFPQTDDTSWVNTNEPNEVT